MKILIPPHPSTNFEIQKYYQNEPRFNSTDNFPQKIKDEAYVITNLEEYAVTHWITLYLLKIENIYFLSFGVEHVPKEV